MDWLNSLAENAELLWAIVITGGGMAVSNVVMFVKTLTMGKKMNKVSDFTVVVNKTIEFAKEEFAEVRKQIVKEVKIDIVEPMISELKSLKQDNAKLTDISVSLLSLVNVPLNAKKQYFEVLSGISNVSDVAKDLLAQSIANDEEKLNESEQETQDLTDTIDDI